MDAENTTSKRITDVYMGDDAFCDSPLGKELFPSGLAMRAFVSGEIKRQLMQDGFIFVNGRSLATDDPQALFDAIVNIKKAASRKMAEQRTARPVYEGIRRRRSASVSEPPTDANA
ncbi:hypothetical protein [Paraburkholderia nodosa]|uniref:hypothetical protein n=1 Tax=Paraburkholderia nodosa TaxID=392320 RepID=UPI000480D9FD|nr:hypothetical protein [Paraburkholderia nodosa]